MNDKDELAFFGVLGVGPEAAVIAARLWGWRNEWLLILSMVLGAAAVLFLFILVEDRLFDESGYLKTKHRKLITQGLGGLFIVLLVVLIALCSDGDY